MRARLVPLLVILALSGCIAADPSQPADTPADPNGAGPIDVVPWGLEGCRYIVAFGHVDADRLEPYLPEGFTPRPSLPDALATVGNTWFGFDVMSCTSGTGLNTSVAPIEYGYLWASADPPAQYLQEGVDDSEHYAKWDVLVPDAPRREFLQARGLHVHDGTARIDDSAPSISAALSLDGVGEFSIEGVATGKAGPFDGSFAKISAAGDGVAAWRAAALSGPRETGSAILAFPAGSWAEEVVGGTELVGQYHAGTWSYSDSEIRLLASDLPAR